MLGVLLQPQTAEAPKPSRPAAPQGQDACLQAFLKKAAAGSGSVAAGASQAGAWTTTAAAAAATLPASKSVRCEQLFPKCAPSFAFTSAPVAVVTVIGGKKRERLAVVCEILGGEPSLRRDSGGLCVCWGEGPIAVALSNRTRLFDFFSFLFFSFLSFF
jgi:hypothetical protein